MTSPLTPVVLTGRKVRLEPLDARHVPGLLRAATLDRASFALTFVPATPDEALRYVDAALAEHAAARALPFATLDAGSGEVVGSTRFGNVEWWSWPEARPGLPDAAEIGWTWLAPCAQRSGLNREAKLLMLTHAFESWGVRRVTLKTDVRNDRSRRAIEGLGFRLDGVLRAHSPAADGGVRDVAMYSLLAAEWPGARASLESRLR